MSKNLILVHLESISNSILWQYRGELKTIWQMRQQSFNYNRFYASATSTVMSSQALNAGRSNVFDGVSNWGQMADAKHPEYCRNRLNTIPNYLFFAGYLRAGRLVSALEIGDTKETTISAGRVMARSQEDLLPYVRATLSQHKVDGKPFFFHHICEVTHITYQDQVKEKATSFSERFRLGYVRLDSSVRQFLAILAEMDLLRNSVIVFYGDHGDELWSHGLNGGWCHVITPYASQCWTPLFIYDADCKPGSTNQLASMIDLKETLIKRVLPDFIPENCHLTMPWKNRDGDEPPFPVWRLPCLTEGSLPPFRDSPFCGIDLARETREFAFSQNLFALQNEFNDPAKALIKGYAVTDGIYRVTVTSGGHDPRDGGLEFFCDPLDPTNSRNLLDFFTLDANGDIEKFYPPPEAVNRDFALSFNPEAIENLIETFQKLKHALYDHVIGKEEEAKKHSYPNQGHALDKSAFKHSRRKPYKD